MRVVMLTANIGGYDTQTPEPPLQRLPTTMLRFTEENLPYPLPRLDNRMKAKFLKCQTHRFIEADYYIWYDSSVEIISPEFSAYMVGLLANHDMAVPLHWARKSAMEEIEYVQRSIAEGHEVLVNRYGNERIEIEAEYYRQCGLPMDYPCFVTRFFSWRNTPKIRACMDDWWRHCIQFSSFDQSMLSLMTYLHDVKVNAFRYDDIVGSLIAVHGHIKNW